MGRKPVPLNLSEEDIAALTALSEREDDFDLARRAKLILALNRGETLNAISEQYGLYTSSINYWKQRYREFGVQGLYTFNAEEAFGAPLRDKLLETLQKTPPGGADAWDVALLEKELVFPARKIRRYLEREGIQLRDPEMERVAAEKEARRSNRKLCRFKLTLELLDGEERVFGMYTATQDIVPAPLSRAEYGRDPDLRVEDRNRMLLLVQAMERTIYQEMNRLTITMDFSV